MLLPSSSASLCEARCFSPFGEKARLHGNGILLILLSCQTAVASFSGSSLLLLDESYGDAAVLEESLQLRYLNHAEVEDGRGEEDGRADLDGLDEML